VADGVLLIASLPSRESRDALIYEQFGSIIRGAVELIIVSGSKGLS